MSSEDDLPQIVAHFLKSGDSGRLEQVLSAHEDLIPAFAAMIGEIVTQPEPPVDRLEKLLDGWAALQDESRAKLSCAAVRAYGRVAVVRPDWRDDEIAKLHRAAADRRGQVRAAVIEALREMLAADAPGTHAALAQWKTDQRPLLQDVVSAVLGQ